LDGILFSEALAVEGAVVFAKACELGLEGIVSMPLAGGAGAAQTNPASRMKPVTATAIVQNGTSPSSLADTDRGPLPKPARESSENSHNR
jgi:hypothetical protein